MSATIQKMQCVKAKGTVSFRNLVINVKNMTFSVEYSLLTGRKRKHVYQKVEGVITNNVKRWLTKGFQANENAGGTIIDGKTTAFMQYLHRNNIEWREGILGTLEWTCDNLSPDSDEFPFKLTISDRYGATLDQVYRNSKVLLGVTINPENGKVFKEFGYPKYHSIKKENFCRLIQFKETEE